MIQYYYDYKEPPERFGSFSAKSDKDAKGKMPKGADILYKESDTPDGTPFIIIWERKPRYIHEVA